MGGTGLEPVTPSLSKQSRWHRLLPLVTKYLLIRPSAPEPSSSWHLRMTPSWPHWPHDFLADCPSGAEAGVDELGSDLGLGLLVEAGVDLARDLGVGMTCQHGCLGQ